MPIFTYTCLRCGKQFSTRGRGRKFCSLACHYANAEGKPRHPNSGRKARSKTVQFTCETCGKPFAREITPKGRKEYSYCSTACSNKARSRPLIPCPVCGTLFNDAIVDAGGVRRKHCSPTCANIASRGPRPKGNETELLNRILELREQFTYREIAQQLGMSLSSVTRICYRAGKPLSKELYAKRVHGAAGRHMQEHNPMHNATSKAKVKAFWDVPENRERQLAFMATLRQKQQKLKPTKLELALYACLESLGVAFEPYAIIKPNFVVDARIGNLIIQADGDYWHGHPRFYPLTERQLAQQRRDAAQDTFLRSHGYTVVRFWERDFSEETIRAILSDNHIALT